MYKNILCAVDASTKNESEIILSKAAALAKQNACNLFLAHVIEYTFLPKDYQNKLEQEIQPKMSALAEKHCIPKKNVFIKFGQSYPAICELEKSLKIDLIVVGSHGKNGLQSLLGATANGVLQQAAGDVLLIKIN